MFKAHKEGKTKADEAIPMLTPLKTTNAATGAMLKNVLFDVDQLTPKSIKKETDCKTDYTMKFETPTLKPKHKMVEPAIHGH